MDLDMPIMNGWEAAKNLSLYFNEDQKLFKHQNLS